MANGSVKENLEKIIFSLIALFLFASLVIAQEKQQTNKPPADSSSSEVKTAMCNCPCCQGAMGNSKMKMQNRQGGKTGMSCSCCMGNEKRKSSKGSSSKTNSSETKVGANSPKPWNEICPVLGNKVNLSTETIIYKGRTYGFCCPACISLFKANPEKYMRNLSKDGKSLIKKI